MQNLKQVRNLNTLKAMERRGLIEIDEQTGTQITGLYGNKKHTCYYVWDGIGSFEYGGKQYRTEYVSGCFKPYIFELISD